MPVVIKRPIGRLLFLLPPLWLFTWQAAQADSWNQEQSAIRNDARATGQAFKKAGKEVGHESVHLYHANKKTFKKIGHSVHAEVPVVKGKVRAETDRHAWIQQDYHKSLSFIKRSARNTYSAMRDAWHHVTQGSSGATQDH